jgi:hypothetical protein
MGVSWSKEEDLDKERENSCILDKDTLVHIFGYVETLDELVRISIVNRWWASLLGKSVVPGVLQRLNLRAWYHQDSIKSIKSSQAPAGSAVCSSWHSSPRGTQLLLDSFVFPSTLRARILGEADPALLAAWIATAAKGGEPRVITSRAGRKCLQFVDTPGRQPVHLRTPPFVTPLAQPVTIICVGIAFEDATFVSGINDRFEVCHAYPNAAQPDNERAPVSITAHPVGDSSDSDDDPIPSCIVSGSTQPGEWHVYTAGAPPPISMLGCYSPLLVFIT